MAAVAQSPRDVEAQVAPQAQPSLEASAACSASTLHSDSAGSASRGKQKQPGCFGALCDLLTPAQKLYCGFAFSVELLLIWLSHEKVTGGPADDVWVYNIAHLMLVSLYPRAPATTQPVAAAGAQRAHAAAAGGAGRARAFFLDGVKMLCTELVLIHHITIGFGGTGGLGWALQFGQYDSNTQAGFGGTITGWLLAPDQSFFMCLLFFVGGIFTPSSLERKGVVEFVRDKLQRLGWPLVVTYFVVSPLSAAFRRAMLVGGGDLSNVWFERGVTWFLGTLIIFNISYAILPFPQVSVPMPSAAQVLLACVALGAVQGWVFYCNFDFLMVGPQTLGALPFDVAFFAAGCLAKRSGWLEGIQGMAPRDFWLARFAALVTVVWSGLSGQDRLLSLPQTPGYIVLCCARDGLMTGGISVSVLHFFAVHCNFPSRWQNLAGQSQYAVYVLQVIVIPGVMLTLLPILRAAGYPVEFFQYGAGFYSSTELPQGVIVGGWLYTILLVTLISWPLGYFFRKLPLVRDVL